MGSRSFLSLDYFSMFLFHFVQEGKLKRSYRDMQRFKCSPDPTMNFKFQLPNILGNQMYLNPLCIVCTGSNFLYAGIIQNGTIALVRDRGQKKGQTQSQWGTVLSEGALLF